MTQKIDHINDAYSQLRISGLTVNPSGRDIETALGRLEDMMAEYEGRNLCLNYQFEENPDTASPSGVERQYNQLIATNLAVRLAVDFNKPVSPSLLAMANGTYSSASSSVAAANIRQVGQPATMPRGSGNTRYNRTYRFYGESDKAPNNCKSNTLRIDDVNDYSEDFAAYLAGETISEYTITPSDYIQIISDSNTDTEVSYRAKGLDTSNTTTHQTVTITILTSTGRVETRVIDFEVI